MKVLMLCACVLALASFSSATMKQQLNDVMNIKRNKNRNDVATCMEENDMNPGDWYEEEEIALNRHTESENQERSRKLGCVFECSFRKRGMMEGTNFIEANVHNSIDENMRHPKARLHAHRIATDCMREVKDITGECKKGMAAYACVMKAIHVVEDHDEHVARDASSQSSQEDAN